jgi:hypothetical protein
MWVRVGPTLLPTVSVLTHASNLQGSLNVGVPTGADRSRVPCALAGVVGISGNGRDGAGVRRRGGRSELKIASRTPAAPVDGPAVADGGVRGAPPIAAAARVLGCAATALGCNVVARSNPDSSPSKGRHASASVGLASGVGARRPAVKNPGGELGGCRGVDVETGPP